MSRTRYRPEQDAVHPGIARLETDSTQSWFEHSQSLLSHGRTAWMRLQAWSQGIQATTAAELHKHWQAWMRPPHRSPGWELNDEQCATKWCLGAAQLGNTDAIAWAIAQGCAPWVLPAKRPSFRSRGWTPLTASPMSWVEEVLMGHQSHLLKSLVAVPHAGLIRVASDSLGLFQSEASLFTLALRHGAWEQATAWWPESTHPDTPQAIQEGLWALCLGGIEKEQPKASPAFRQLLERLLSHGARWDAPFAPSLAAQEVLAPAEEDAYDLPGVPSFEYAGVLRSQSGRAWKDLSYPLLTLFAAVAPPGLKDSAVTCLWDTVPLDLKPVDSWGRPVWASAA